MIDYLLERLKTSPALDTVVMATSLAPGDDVLADRVARTGVAVFRGSESDCLERVHGACLAHGLDVMVRVTGDCPLVPPDTVTEMVRHFLNNRSHLDYLSNRSFTDFPEGTDVEVFGFDALSQAASEATAQREREHINYYFLDRPERFRLRYFNHSMGKDFSRFKLSIDTASNLDQTKELFARFGLAPDFNLPQLLAALERFERFHEAHP